MFERTKLTLPDPFMKNFKMAKFLEKAFTIIIDHGCCFERDSIFPQKGLTIDHVFLVGCLITLSDPFMKIF